MALLFECMGKCCRNMLDTIRAKWRSCSSAWGSVVATSLTPPTLSERPVFDYSGGSVGDLNWRWSCGDHFGQRQYQWHFVGHQRYEHASIRRGHAQTPLYDQGRGHARYLAHHSAFCHSNRCQRKGVCGDPAESGGLWIIPGLTDGGGKQPNSYCKHCASGGTEDKGG